jgi:hypothetical protein
MRISLLDAGMELLAPWCIVFDSPWCKDCERSADDIDSGYNSDLIAKLRGSNICNISSNSKRFVAVSLNGLERAMLTLSKSRKVP